MTETRWHSIKIRYESCIIIKGLLCFWIIILGYRPTVFSAETHPYEISNVVNMESESWEFTSLIQASGLSRRNIFHIELDAENNAWIAASDGLYCCDGYSWKRYGKADGLPSEFVRCIYIDSKKRIWVGTDQGIGVFEINPFKSVSIDNPLSGYCIRRICRDKDDSLWFCCDRWPTRSVKSGLWHFQNNSWKLYTTSEGLPSAWVHNYFRDSQGRQFALTDAGMAVFTNQQWEAVRETGLSENAFVIAMAESKNHELLLQTREGILHRKKNVWEKVSGFSGSSLGVCRDGEVYGLHFEERESKLWIARWNGNEFVPVSQQVSAINGWAEAVAEAPDRAIWCVGPELILRWKPSPCEWTRYPNLPAPQVVDFQGNLWFSDHTSTYRYQDVTFQKIEGGKGRFRVDASGVPWSWHSNRITRWHPTEQITYDSSDTGLQAIDGFLVDKSRQIWIYGLNQNGQTAFAVYEKSGWILKSPPELNSFIILSITPDWTAGIWILAQNSKIGNFQIFHIKADKVIGYPFPSEARNFDNQGLLVGHDGVWLYGFSGLFLMQPDKGRAWSPIAGLNGNNVYGAIQRGDEACFIFDGHSGGGSGYAFRRGGQWEQYSAKVDRFYTHDIEGNFYIKDAGGLIVIPTNQPSFYLALPNNTEYGNLVKARNGDLWIHTADGVLRYQPNREPPKTKLNNWVDQISYGQPIHPKLVGIKRWAPDHPQEAFLFSWRFNNQGPWTPFTNAPSDGISTSELKSGKHFLSVRCQYEGRDIDPVSITREFDIAPVPLQQKPWFIPVTSAVFLLLGYLTLSAFVARRKLAMHAGKLQQMVDDRTQELVRTNEALRREMAERQIAEQALHQAHKMEAIGTLAGGIAHDFNNILAAILPNAHLAKEDAKNNPAVLECLEQILIAGERAKKLVQQIMSFSRRQKHQKQVISMPPIVQEALAMLRHTLPSTIQINTFIQADTPHILADATQIQQVILNLCTNASQAMRGKTGFLTIHIESSHVTLDQARSIPGIHAGLYAILVISDTGHGIKPEHLPRIFDPFFTTKKAGEGTGLGLAVVHGIVKEHEGAITVESVVNQGTTFRIYFPATQGVPLEENTPNHIQVQGEGKHILIVDDEISVCDTLKKVLERSHFQVTSFSMPTEALRCIESQPFAFDLVLTDLTMPNMTGIHLAMKIHRINPDVPILLTTGDCSALDTISLEKNGIREVLIKPVSVDKLSELINRWISKPANH